MRGIVLLAIFAAAAGMAQARTPEQTEAIVLRFNKSFSGGLSKAQVAAMLSDDFIEHHPTPLGATPERTKAQFLARLNSGGPPKGVSVPAGLPPTPPAPMVIVANENYVLLMTRLNTPYPNDPSKTYEQFMFDLFKVNAAGKITDHWDSFTVDEQMARAASKTP